MKAAALCLVAMLVLAGCERTVAVGRYDPTTEAFSGAVVRGGVGGCTGVSEGFSDADLVGTWMGDPGCSRDTTLILRADHTYLDIYEQELGSDHYQGSGQEHWWVEHRQSGVHLLHLQGMHFCHEDQDKPCAQKGPDRGLWFDFCQGVNVQFHDEVVLLIQGMPQGPGAPQGVHAPRGLWLEYLVAEPDSLTEAFELKE